MSVFAFTDEKKYKAALERLRKSAGWRYSENVAIASAYIDQAMFSSERSITAERDNHNLITSYIVFLVLVALLIDIFEVTQLYNLTITLDIRISNSVLAILAFFSCAYGITQRFRQQIAAMKDPANFNRSAHNIKIAKNVRELCTTGVCEAIKRKQDDKTRIIQGLLVSTTVFAFFVQIIAQSFNYLITVNRYIVIVALLSATTYYIVPIFHFRSAQRKAEIVLLALSER